MTQKLLSKSQFARLAGVNASTVTRLLKTLLEGARVGKYIDANSPDAVEYLEKRKRDSRPEAAPGLDGLYDEAVTYCIENNRYSITGLQRGLGVGYERAKKLIALITLNGLIPENHEIKNVAFEAAVDKIVEDEQKKQKSTKPRGQLVVKNRKKAAPPPEANNDTIEIPDDIEMFLEMSLRDLIGKFGTDTRFVDWLSATQKIEAINEKRLKNAQTKGELISRHLVKVGVIDIFNSAHLRLLKDGAKSISAGVIAKHSSGVELAETEAFVSDILGSFIKPVKSKIKRVLKEDK